MLTPSSSTTALINVDATKRSFNQRRRDREPAETANQQATQQNTLLQTTRAIACDLNARARADSRYAPHCFAVTKCRGAPPFRTPCTMPPYTRRGTLSTTTETTDSSGPVEYASELMSRMDVDSDECAESASSS
jgi:hypothetical protein